MKKQTVKIIIAAVTAAVLAFAFWYGGSAPNSRGWTAPTPAPTVEQTAAAAPVQTAKQTAEPAGTPVKGTAETEKPAPDPEKAAPVQDTCKLSISCATLLDNMALLDGDKQGLVSTDGTILASASVAFSEGESVFDVLQRVCRDGGIQMESTVSPLYQTAYIEGINNFYEFDAGEESGWMYSVNGIFPGYGCSQYKLKDGDTVAWVYTCDLGADVGASGGWQK